MSGDAPRPPVRDTNPVIDLAIRRPVGLLMICSAIFVFGGISLMRLPMDLMPEISYPTITVRTNYPGAAPEDVEDRVSRRLEQSLSVVKGLSRISSISRAESSDVVLEFTWDTDMKNVVQEVREKIDQTFLPDDVEAPTILRYDPSLDPVLQVGLVGDADLRALRLVAEEEVERRLETVPGVAAVKVRGGLEEEIRIEVDEDRLRSRGLTQSMIAQRLREENLDQASGILEEGDVAYVVRTRNELRSVEEIAGIPLKREGDTIIRLDDVAEVVSTHKDLRVITRIGGRPAVKIEVYREAGANIVALAQRVKLRLYGTPGQRQQYRRWLEQQSQRGAERESEADTEAETDNAKATESEESEDDSKDTKKNEEKLVGRPGHIDARLDGEELVVLSDQSTFIEGSIRDLYQTALVGGLLAILVLYFFLGRFSYTAVVAVSIPFSVVASFAPMYLGDITLNIMSLGGLALGLGMLVDSSIVVLEAIFRHREAGRGAFEAAVLGASEVGGAVFASVLTTVAVFFPIVFVEGMAGQIFRDQALTVVFSLTASLVASLTLIPMLAARFGGFGDSSGRAAPSLRSWHFESLATLKRATKGKRDVPALWPVLFVYVPLYLVVELIGFVLYAIYTFIIAVVRILFGGIARFSGSKAGIAVRAFSRVFVRIEAGYVRLLDATLRHRPAVIAIAALFVVAAVFAGGQLGSELIPEVAQGEFIVLVRYPVGTPIETTEARVKRFEEQLAALEEVASVATTIGVDPEEVTDGDEGEHTARFRVRLERTREKQSIVEERMLGEFADIFSGVADFSVDVSRPTLFSFKTPIEVEVRGHNLTRLRQLGLEVESILAEMDELKDVRTNIAPGNPEYHLFPDREKMARQGISSQQLADVIRRKNMGEVATRYRQDDRKVDVRVQLEEGDRDSIDNLLALVVAPREGGGGWTVGDLIKGWKPREGPSEIRRIGQQRASVVSAGLTGVDLGRISEDIEDTLLRQVQIPPDFVIEVVGQKKEMERSRSSLIGALLLAIFLVYVVMASQFESLIQPFIILFTIPLAAVGVTVTLYLTGTTLSVMSFIGMIMLAGIVVNNAIVLVDQVNRQRRDGKSVHDALIEGGRRRLRPILMTTLTTVLAMIPITGILAEIPHGPALDFLMGSGQGAEIRAPLALTVIGGLLSSTLLTLLVIPVVYSIVIRDRAGSGADAPAEGA